MPDSQSVEDLVINTLQHGTKSTAELIKTIALIRANSTKQGVYRVLRKLKQEEKIIIHGKEVSLNLHWIKKMSESFSLAEFYYSPKAAADSFLNLTGRDKIIYFFKNFNSVDSFASHVLHMLNEVVDPREPLFAYNPHEWFAYARQEAEELLIDVFGKIKRQVLIRSLYDYPLDRSLNNQFNTDLLQYDISDNLIGGKSNYYFTFLGTYLMEIWFDERVIQELDAWYRETKVYDQNAAWWLKKIVFTSSRNKLVISRNTNKIEKYKRMLSKSFYIKSA